jgi:hypothetical protein
MKKIFTLLASFILTLSLFAATRPKTMLTIQSHDQSDIRVVIDGRRFEPNTSFMRIRDIQPGYHQVKIYREKRSGLFTIFGQRYEMVYNSSMFIRQQSNVMITIDRHGRAKVSDRRMNGRNNDWDDRNRGWSNDNDYDFDRGRSYGDYGDRDRDWNDRDSRWDKNRDRRNDNGGWGNNGGYGNGGYGNNNGGYFRAMSDNEFGRALTTISNERSNYSKLQVMQQVIHSNYFTSAQVRQMLQLLSFETDKVDMAKLAYDKTVDKQSYFVVNDVFSYSSSKDELARYIRSH